MIVSIPYRPCLVTAIPMAMGIRPKERIEIVSSASHQRVPRGALDLRVVPHRGQNPEREATGDERACGGEPLELQPFDTLRTPVPQDQRPGRCQQAHREQHDARCDQRPPAPGRARRCPAGCPDRLTGSSPSSWPGANIMASVPTTMTPMPSQASGRHRGDGSRPVGNSSVRKTPISAIGGSQLADRVREHGVATGQRPRVQDQRPPHVDLGQRRAPPSRHRWRASPSRSRLRGCCRVMSRPTSGNSVIISRKRTSIGVTLTSRFSETA